jgi:hypothetical protein
MMPSWMATLTSPTPKPQPTSLAILKNVHAYIFPPNAETMELRCWGCRTARTMKGRRPHQEKREICRLNRRFVIDRVRLSEKCVVTECPQRHGDLLNKRNGNTKIFAFIPLLPLLPSPFFSFKKSS